MDPLLRKKYLVIYSTPNKERVALLRHAKGKWRHWSNSWETGCVRHQTHSPGIARDFYSDKLHGVIASNLDWCLGGVFYGK
jgi:hypothetical protein